MCRRGRRAVEMTSFQKFFYSLVKTFFLIFHTLYNRLEVRGRENIPPTGRLIVASNHASNVDPPLIGAVFPGYLRFLAKESLFRNPLLGFCVRSLAAVPVTREDSQRAGAVMKLMLGLLQSGERIVIFPEGTRSRDGRLKPLEPGAAFLSLKADAPILPVYIAGSHDACPPGRVLYRPKKLVVTFAPPIPPDAGEGGERARRERMMERLDVALRAMQKEADAHA